MRTIKKRWGEVTIKKQGEGGKNIFDKTKSFSVDNVGYNYTIEEYWGILKLVTDLTENITFVNMRNAILKIKEKKVIK